MIIIIIWLLIFQLDFLRPFISLIYQLFIIITIS